MNLKEKGKLSVSIEEPTEACAYPSKNHGEKIYCAVKFNLPIIITAYGKKQNEKLYKFALKKHKMNLTLKTR